jgi:hypothetical protein
MNIQVVKHRFSQQMRKLLKTNNKVNRMSQLFTFYYFSYDAKIALLYLLLLLLLNVPVSTAVMITWSQWIPRFFSLAYIPNKNHADDDTFYKEASVNIMVTK